MAQKDTGEVNCYLQLGVVWKLRGGNKDVVKEIHANCRRQIVLGAERVCKMTQMVM